MADRSELPAFSATTIKLMQATQDQETAIDDLGKIIAMCLALGVNQRVAQAVRFHHDPLSESSLSAPLGYARTSFHLVSVANVSPKLVKSAFESNAEVPPNDALPEWEYLAQFDRYSESDIDVWKAQEEAEQDMLSMVS